MDSRQFVIVVISALVVWCVCRTSPEGFADTASACTEEEKQSVMDKCQSGCSLQPCTDHMTTLQNQITDQKNIIEGMEADLTALQTDLAQLNGEIEALPRAQIKNGEKWDDAADGVNWTGTPTSFILGPNTELVLRALVPTSYPHDNEWTTLANSLLKLANGIVLHNGTDASQTIALTDTYLGSVYDHIEFYSRDSRTKIDTKRTQFHLTLRDASEDGEVYAVPDAADIESDNRDEWSLDKETELLTTLFAGHHANIADQQTHGQNKHVLIIVDF